MEIQEIEAEQQRERRRAATRERVRKHRAANSLNLGTLRQEPQSGKERSRKSRLRKKQLRQAVPPNVENQNSPGGTVNVQSTTTSIQRTRRYRQRQRERSHYQKPAPLSQAERNCRCYAKRQQISLPGQITEAVDGLVGYNVCRFIREMRLIMKQ